MRSHPVFAGAPDRMKIAVDGAWERAVTWVARDIPARLATQPFAQALAPVTLDDAADVACEAFFGEAFFGIRQRGTVVQMLGFIEQFARIVATSRTGPALFDLLEQALPVKIGCQFRYCELGAEGAWASVGPVRIADPLAASRDPDALVARIAESGVGRDTSHPKALEFVYANDDDDSPSPTTHWFALPVSQGPRLDHAAVLSALSKYR